MRRTRSALALDVAGYQVSGRERRFSFFSNKNLAIGEGGMVVTSDPEVADRIRLLRSQWMTTDDLTGDRHRGHPSAYDVAALGDNSLMSRVRRAAGRQSRRRSGPDRRSGAPGHAGAADDPARLIPAMSRVSIHEHC